MLKNNSSMWMMYFRLKLHRKSILIGNAAIVSTSVANTMYRAKPILMKKVRKIVLAKSGGNTKRYASTTTKPGS